MIRLIDGSILYHGSYCEVRDPDLRQCARYKDFGQGFYLTSSRRQAVSFIRTSVKKAAFNSKISAKQHYGMLSVFHFTSHADLDICTYPTADADWLHCVVGHRRKNTFPALVKEMKKYDIIAGKIANDDTNATIAAYMAQVYGTIGTKSADDMCISLLLPERLQDQYCFRTDRALKCITFVESEQIWIE